MIPPSANARRLPRAAVLTAALAACPLVALSACADGDEPAASGDGRAISKIEIDGAVSLSTGERRTFVARAVYEDGSARALGEGEAAWRSSDERVAVVDEGGEVHALVAGMITLTVEHGDVFETRTLVVLP